MAPRGIRLTNETPIVPLASTASGTISVPLLVVRGFHSFFMYFFRKTSIIRRLFYSGVCNHVPQKIFFPLRQKFWEKPMIRPVETQNWTEKGG